MDSNKKNYPQIAIIILNWNGKQDTIECLESLYQITYPNYEVVLIDNHSTDESIEGVKKWADGEILVESKFFEYNRYSKPIKYLEYTREESEKGAGKELGFTQMPSNRKIIIIRNEKNYGFAEGNNIGIRYALRSLAVNYVLLLNNDTVVDKKFLEELINVAENNEKIGVIGPKLYFYEKPQIIQTTGVNIDFWTGRTIPVNFMKTDNDLNTSNNQLLYVDYVYGACFLINRNVIENVGFLDPTYFLYGEETDWCLRIKRAGYIVVCNLRSKIWHKSMASSSKTSRFSIYYPARNRVMVMRKYSSLFKFLSFVIFYPIYNIIIFLNNKKWMNIGCFLRGFIDGLFMKK